MNVNILLHKYIKNQTYLQTNSKLSPRFKRCSDWVHIGSPVGKQFLYT